jgi:antitoxin component YwqK of YwqJK toxin-antitoxin module
MKHLIILLLISSFSFAQDINKFDENGKRHGLWKGTHEGSKRPRYEGTFEHGKEVGMFKYFDDTHAGTVIATRDFDAKNNSCYVIFYNQQSLKVSEGKVVNKQFEGEWKYYHFNSPQIMTLENYKNGKLEGIRKVYYRSGALAEETSYVNGVKNGLYKNYAENGVIIEESIYKNGQYEGEAIYRNGTNNIVSQGIYKNGKKVGIWKIADKNGNLIDTNMNKQGKKFQKRVKPLDETQN